jgi:hypothetical protein
VKLATCRALKATANWETAEAESDTILPHLEIFIQQISRLLNSVENLESQKVLTETLRLVIEKGRSNVGLRHPTKQKDYVKTDFFAHLNRLFPMHSSLLTSWLVFGNKLARVQVRIISEIISTTPLS